IAILEALIHFYFRLIPRDWYRKLPFLPVPPAEYIRWRLRTAYGKHRPPWRDVLRDVWQFGDWLRTFNQDSIHASTETFGRGRDPSRRSDSGDPPARG